MFESLTQIGLPIALILIMTGVGMSLRPANFSEVLRQPTAFIVGAVAQMLLLPLVAVAVIALFGLQSHDHVFTAHRIRFRSRQDTPLFLHGWHGGN